MMLPKSTGQKTLRAAMLEERASSTTSTTTMASRLVSTADGSISNRSFRVYYGVASAGSVPFLWESAPGTPKNAISGAALPPLTPPPSYYNNKKAAAKLAKSNSSKRLHSSSRPASFVHSILPKFRRSYTMPPSSPSSAASNDAASAQVQCSARRKRLVASPRSSFSSTSRGEDDDGESTAHDGRDAAASPTSTLCFRSRHSAGGGARGLHGLLASVVGGHGTR
ncbi:hypothetical protein GUJ93_ZPchr0010g10010 [Zizania palustris]|uniref:Uncharacterized protein n=1 Tax=Zizania palustris TaxID=103762 RepID=A0A8J6BH68_ZIZPA|nr:hypothetical protein GUJ93_ZPchr0010g10010 [Zizania palustris]